MRKAFTLLATLLFSFVAAGQSVQVSSTNKTIAITADDSVSVDADMAIISIGYENYAQTHREAYENNLKVATAVVKALLDGGVKPEVIKTGKVSVTTPEPSEYWTAEEKRARKFYAHQTWKITVPASDAPKVADLAMRSGANQLNDVDWEYSNRPELQAKAGAAALAKARAIAEQMANGLGAKLGALIYASNKAEVVADYPVWRSLYASPAVSRNASTKIVLTPGTSLQLFPDKVSQSATVYAVFAIE